VFTARYGLNIYTGVSHRLAQLLPSVADPRQSISHRLAYFASQRYKLLPFYLDQKDERARPEIFRAANFCVSPPPSQ
jgi:hypothetical protein